MKITQSDSIEDVASLSRSKDRTTSFYSITSDPFQNVDLLDEDQMDELMENDPASLDLPMSSLRIDQSQVKMEESSDEGVYKLDQHVPQDLRYLLNDVKSIGRINYGNVIAFEDNIKENVIIASKKCMEVFASRSTPSKPMNFLLNCYFIGYYVYCDPEMLGGSKLGDMQPWLFAKCVGNLIKHIAAYEGDFMECYFVRRQENGQLTVDNSIFCDSAVACSTFFDHLSKTQSLLVNNYGELSKVYIVRQSTSLEKVTSPKQLKCRSLDHIDWWSLDQFENIVDFDGRNSNDFRKICNEVFSVIRETVLCLKPLIYDESDPSLVYIGFQTIESCLYTLKNVFKCMLNELRKITYKKKNRVSVETVKTAFKNIIESRIQPLEFDSDCPVPSRLPDYTGINFYYTLIIRMENILMDYSTREELTSREEALRVNILQTIQGHLRNFKALSRQYSACEAERKNEAKKREEKQKKIAEETEINKRQEVHKKRREEMLSQYS